MKNWFEKLFCSHSWERLPVDKSFDYLSTSQSAAYWNVWKCKYCKKISVKLNNKIMYQDKPSQ